MSAKPRQSGFILMYVVLMVAALAVMLAAMQRIRPPSTQGVEKQISLALQSVETRAFLDYIIAGMKGEPLILDPRFEAYQQVLRDKQTQLADSDDRITFLKEILRSLNYDLDINAANRKKSSADRGSQLDLQAKANEAKAKDANRLFTPFSVRKEAYTYNLGQTTYQITIHPANAKPNLNQLDKETLERYFKYLKVPPERIRTLVGTLLDWRDPDDMTSDGGAEADSYPDYRPSNAPIRLWQELAYLKDMDPSLLRLLRDNFTLDGSSAVAADYASPELIAVLADLPLRTVQVAYEHHEISKTELENNRVQINDILLDDEVRRFQAVATWAPYSDIRLIRIAAPNYVRSLRYDMNTKKVLETW